MQSRATSVARFAAPLAMAATLSACAPGSAGSPAERVAALRAAEPGAAHASVAEMIERVRRGSASGKAGTAISFAPGSAFPDADGLRVVRALAPAARDAGGATVTARSDTDGSYLDQRRAVAVAKILDGTVPDVVTRFDKDAPPGRVVVTMGSLPRRLPDAAASPATVQVPQTGDAGGTE
jgi:hypothetical protein